MRKFVGRNFKTRKKKTVNNMDTSVNFGSENSSDSSDSDGGYLSGIQARESVHSVISKQPRLNDN